MWIACVTAALTLGFTVPLCAAAPDAARSHPALRALPPVSHRPMPEGPSRFVDATAGSDTAQGTRDAPWRTIGHALEQLQPGETLLLREGVYRENVYLALAGRKDAPITIRGFPGERAIIDGGLREFFESPRTCWVPRADEAAAGEYRSARPYPNLRNVVGSFGDSMVGLQTYYHAKDLRAENELIDWQDWDRPRETDVKPFYCGPGLWYDRESGYIHIRLAHTHLPEPVANYRGETDPRKLPLVIAPFRSVPVTLDRAAHVRLRDLVIRGAGYTAVVLDQASDIEFDNVTVWCGTYGLRVSGTRGLRFLESALYGNVAPWTFRNDGSKRDYPDRPHRNISRLNTHALVEIDSGRESSVYATPQNDDWEFAHSEFTEAHDGLYLGGINARFHHNLIENLQDDGLYLSPMYLRHRLDNTDPEIHIHQNVFRGVLTALAFGGSEPETRDRVSIYRNLFDLRPRVNTGRPTTRRAEPGFSTGKLMGDHGSPPWPAMCIYHNTIVAAGRQRDAAMAALGHASAERPRRALNNVFYHFERLPGLIPPDPSAGVVADGNLYWSPGATQEQAERLFGRFRASKQFAESRRTYAPGSTAHSLVADPRFLRSDAQGTAENDYRLRADSPAVDAGVELPEGWPDPLRTQDRGRPNIGAFPHGSYKWNVFPGRSPGGTR